jgi:hypothetical protein
VISGRVLVAVKFASYWFDLRDGDTGSEPVALDSLSPIVANEESGLGGGLRELRGSP